MFARFARLDSSATAGFASLARSGRPVYSAGLRGPMIRRFNSTLKQSAPKGAAKKETGLRALMREYGYSGLGVYLALAAIDLPLCYLLVHSAGEEKISDLQNRFLTWIGWKDKDFAGNGEEDASSEKGSTFWTEFAVAYALHKSLIVIRLPLTAAITPAIVSKLRSMGFDIGNLSSAAVQTVRKEGLRQTLTKEGVKDVAKDMKFDPTASNPKFGKPPTKGQRWWFF
ncbi:DEKNAAC103648 [Brettanomyces naardenensis]|uniref:DEKNAAC103648 n=1 Tax=Brettanomyces naardenensis TaxID=13370 RepID=A0A448YNS7_BRENA|nr:DEKNAAC103648 [Brettanomyces naardenensis]